MNSNNDQERAQKLADICNRNGITRDQLAQALHKRQILIAIKIN